MSTSPDTGTSTDAEPVVARLSTVDRLLPVWILAAVALGLLAGRLIPGLGRALDAVSVSGVSLPIALGLLVMMYPVLAKVRYDRLDTVTGDRRLMVASLVLNWQNPTPASGPITVLRDGKPVATLPATATQYTDSNIAAASGIYRINYTLVRNNIAGDLRVVGHFRDQNGQITTKEATTTVEVVGGDNVQNVTITAPNDNDRVADQVTVRGTGTPGATVQIDVTALGTQFYVFEYREELGANQVRVGRNGNWQSGPITLPRPVTNKTICDPAQTRSMMPSVSLGLV